MLDNKLLYQRIWDAVGAELTEAFRRVGSSGNFILGCEVDSFETELSSYTASRYAVGVGNGMDAIEIALRAMQLPVGAKVLTTPLSAFASSLAIVRAGGVPVFVDTDESGQLNLDLVEQILAEDPNIRYLVPVHLYGQALDLVRLQNLISRFETIVIEDCAQAIGASFAGKKVGSVGQASAISFYPTKNLGAFGDGGAVFTNSEASAERFRILRNYGQKVRYSHVELGLNSRLDEVQAAILRVHLRYLDQWTQRRREIASQYYKSLANPNFSFLKNNNRDGSVFHLFPIRMHAPHFRKEFMTYCQDHGLSLAIHYPSLISDQEALGKAPFELRSPLTLAKELSETVVSLPIHPYLNDSEIQQITELCNKWRP